MGGAKSSVRTELVAQLEEQGYIETIMSLLKEKNTPMPIKVAGTEVLKVRLTSCQLAILVSHYAGSTKLLSCVGVLGNAGRRG
eukprot:SAG31_NODE_294_length_18242_cov_28.418949_19_plen_83_part_00